MFYNNVFDAKNASTAVNYIEENYIQHNPFVPRGIEAFINFFTRLFDYYPDFSQIKRVYLPSCPKNAYYLSIQNQSQSEYVVNCYLFTTVYLFIKLLLIYIFYCLFVYILNVLY